MYKTTFVSQTLTSINTNMLKLTAKLTYRPCLIIASVLFFTALLLFILIECKTNPIIQALRKKPIDTSWNKKTLAIQIILGTTLILSLLYFVEGMTTVYIAKKHGLYQDTMTWEKILEYNESTPEESKLPEKESDLTTSIILFYRYSCPDCDAVYPKERIAASKIKNIYWVSTRSEQGNKLLEKYPIKEVPAGVYITKNGDGVIQYLDSKSKSNRFNQENFDKLLSLYKDAHPEEFNK